MADEQQDIGEVISTPLFDAIQFAWENDIWPSSRNLATILGYKDRAGQAYPKLNGRMNKERIRILRAHFHM